MKVQLKAVAFAAAALALGQFAPLGNVLGQRLVLVELGLLLELLALLQCNVDLRLGSFY